MFATAQHDGYKSPTEDRVKVTPIHETMTMYSVFDGHSGYQLAAAAASTLTEAIKERILENGSNPSTSQLEKIMVEEFERFDNESRYLQGRGMSGTTATCAIVTPTHIVVANVGDSPAILFKDGALVAATVDHDGYNPDEVSRVNAAGGYVSNRNDFGNMRINNCLSVSRALGNYLHKNFHSQVIIPTPQTYVWDRVEGAYLAVCSDSFTEVIGVHPGGKRDISGAPMQMIVQDGTPETIVAELTNVLTDFPDNIKLATEAAVERRTKKFYFSEPHNCYAGDNTSLILVKL